MVLTCGKCARANPPDAAYCYFDGIALGGPGRGRGPVAVSRAVFASPFVFPNGHTCRNFDELVLACQQEWTTARDLFRQCHLQSLLTPTSPPARPPTRPPCLPPPPPGRLPVPRPSRGPAPRPPPPPPRAERD